MSTNGIGVTSKDLRNLACAATGASINRANDSEELKQILLFGGGVMALPTAYKAGKAAVWDLPKWGYQNYGNYNNAFKTAWNNSVGQTNLYAANRSSLKGNFGNTVQNNSLKMQLDNLTIPNYTDPVKADIYKEVNKLTEEAKGLQGKRLQVKLRQIEKAKAEADIALQQAKAAGRVKSSTKIGQAASYVKTKTGIRTAQTKIIEGTISKNPVVKTLAKGAKAGGGMAVISAALEAPTVYQTYKELGAKKGTKQLGKSLVKVGAETAGYVVGAKVGGIAGAKIGATVGTFIGGPIGTAVGGVIGTVIGVGCGLLGSWLCGKAARKVVGEDELEKVKNEQANQLADAAQDNKDLQVQLAVTAKEKLESGEIASEKDANDIISSYNNVVDKLKQDITNENQPSNPSSVNQNNNTANESRNNNPINTNDYGLQALFSLAQGKTQNNSFSFQGFYPGMNIFNQTYNNPFGSFQQFNPFMINMGMNSFNPFFNPFMINPYQFNSFAA